MTGSRDHDRDLLQLANWLLQQWPETPSPTPAEILSTLELFPEPEEGYEWSPEVLAYAQGLWDEVGGFIRERARLVVGTKEDHRRMVVEGIERAKANGVHCGRPWKVFDFDRALSLLRRGFSLTKTAAAVGVSRKSLKRRLDRDGYDLEGSKVEEKAEKTRTKLEGLIVWSKTGREQWSPQ